jgi:hypothetical protein
MSDLKWPCRFQENSRVAEKQTREDEFALKLFGLGVVLRRGEKIGIAAS